MARHMRSPRLLLSIMGNVIILIWSVALLSLHRYTFFRIPRLVFIVRLIVPARSPARTHAWPWLPYILLYRPISLPILALVLSVWIEGILVAAVV